MKAEMRKFFIVGAAAVVSGLILACGGGSNNDQGVSVTFLGLYENLPVNNNNNNNNTTTGLQSCTRYPNQRAQPTPVALGDTSGVYAIAGVQNNLFGQFFRTNQIVLDFFIAGAAIQPPSYTGGLSIFTGPAENSQVNNNNNNNGNGNNTDDRGLRQPQNTSLPPSFGGICNAAFSRVPILPPQIQQWLVFNQGMLPGAPYTVDVTARLVGQSSSGDIIETNSLYVAVDIVPAGSISPTPTASAQSASADQGSFEGDTVYGDEPSSTDETEGDVGAEDPMTEQDTLE